MLMKRLALKISKELSIDPANRVTDGQAFLTDCFSEFNTALEQGNPIEKVIHNHLAFTPLPKKERYNLIGLASAAVEYVSGTPRKDSSEFSSRENLSRLGEPRAKKLWSLVDKAQIASHFPRGSSSPSRLNGTSPGASTPEERDVELAAQGS
jgi:hypothetical protein